ncbi:MAG: hypothetical protein HYR63_11890 [Proteobacteria bacterium]|nr:hypothetical protein [Pseudomonadota bacterium]MBI3498536.1 hypothetical protein [Pseudomonadota bacterium]
MRRDAPRHSKPQPPSRMTLYRSGQRVRGLRSRRLWIVDPPQSAVEAAVKKIARNEPAEIRFVQRNVDRAGWK